MLYWSHNRGGVLMTNYKDVDAKIMEALDAREPARLEELLTELRAQGEDISKCLGEHNYIEYAYNIRAPQACYESLLRAGASSIARIKNRNAPLYRAVSRGDLPIAQSLIENGAAVNIWGANSAEEYYLEGFYDINIKTGVITPRFTEPAAEDHEKGAPITKPLICAAIENYYSPEGREIIDHLLARSDLKLLSSDELKDNAYSYAVAYGDSELLTRLTRLEPKIIDYAGNNNLLNIAVENGKYENLRYLLEEIKIPVNSRSKVWAQDCLEKLLEIHNEQIELYLEGYPDSATLKKVITEDRRLAGLVNMFTLLRKHGVVFTAISKKRYAAANEIEHSILPRSQSGNEHA